MVGIMYLVVFFINNMVIINQAARILVVIPTPSVSHHIVFRPLTQELVKRGHEVVVITTDPAFPKGQTPANLTEIDVHDISHEMWQKEFLASALDKNNDMHAQWTNSLRVIARIFEKQMQTGEVKSLILTKQFDLLLIEAWVRPTIALSQVFRAPAIQISSLGYFYGNQKTIGSPIHPLLYPILTRQKLYNLTLWEKVNEVYNQYLLQKVFESYEEVETDMLQINFGPDFTTFSKLFDNVQMLFVNIHPIWNGNQPVPLSVIHMGGIHQTPEKELTQDLKSYLDSSKSGVIYVSFGTNTNPSCFLPEKINIFLKVFAQLPYDVLWKWDKDELPGKPKNIRISKWFPQPVLLRHPNIKLFITQGGLQSTDEAITAGVPLIAVPMMADQWYNAEKYVYHRIGIRLYLATLTETKLKTAVNTVIGDISYRHNIVRLGSLMRDQPQKSLERTVWWIEYVMRHGGAKHLRAPAANMSWSEYFVLDIVLPLIMILIAFVVLLTVLTYRIIHIIMKFLKVYSK